MADEELAPEGSEALELAPETQTEAAETAETPESQPDPIEALAAKMGWAPKDQFRGNADDWKPADEFIIAGKDIQRNLSRELKEVKATVSNMSRTTATLLEQQLAERDAYWQQQRREAVEMGDLAAVDRADEERKKLRQQPAVAPAMDPAVESFTQKHSAWFNKDAEATQYAINRAQIYADQGLSTARQLAAVEQDMKGIFPELFPAPAKPAPSVSRPASRAATTSNRGKSLHDMPAEAQAVARDMVARGVIPNTDVYVTNYFNQPERKVG